MKEDFQNIVFNTLNDTVEKLKGNATAFENKLKAFSEQVDGNFTVPQGRFNSSKLEPRLQDITGTLASLVSLPLVEVPYKHWKIVFAGWWLAPPPLGPIILVSASFPIRPELKLGVRGKRRNDLAKVLAAASAPSDLAMREFIKRAMPDFQHKDALAAELYERELWMALPQARTGIIEIDNACGLSSNDSELGKKLFTDWKARESYIRIAKRSDFAINGNKNLITLLLHSNPEMNDLKDSLEFFKSVLDRSYKLNISS
ncbi:MAG: hypothetical protein JST89_23280 [Cyanobacteria bacterium SZAS-4]|nr:hypothetical protein [Cyanobacteria bacterium SZAS-4]